MGGRGRSVRKEHAGDPLVTRRAVALRESLSKRFVIAKFPGVDLGWVRLGGPGLGNLLFIWARALVRSIESGATLVPPVWHQIKIGPWLRREPDKRSYVDVFPFRPPSAVWTEWVRCRLAGRHVERLGPSVEKARGTEYEIVADGRPCFHDLEPYRDTIRSALIRSVRPSAIPSEHERPTIAVHVRLGDFAPPEDEEVRIEVNRSFPLSWYLRAIQWAQETSRYSEIPLTIFSDGTDVELDLLFRRFRTTLRSAGRNALHDLLALSRAELVIGSHSTFTYWAFFLGTSSLLMPSGLDLTRFFSPAFVAGRVVSIR